MNDRIVKLDPSEHCSVQELLPWFVNGTLDGGEAARVREHVQGCTQCQADIDWQRRTLASAAAAEVESTDAAAQALAAERALARLRPRLRAAPRARFLPRWFRGEVWIRWALAAQAALIAGLALLLMPPADDVGGAYRGLGAADRAADVVVMFRPDTSEQELRRILRASGARIVDGPTATDAYLLDVPDAQRARIVAALRAQAAVALAEPLDAGGGR